jgi:hypothetical protein
MYWAPCVNAVGRLVTPDTGVVPAVLTAKENVLVTESQIMGVPAAPFALQPRWKLNVAVLVPDGSILGYTLVVAGYMFAGYCAVFRGHVLDT